MAAPMHNMTRLPSSSVPAGAVQRRLPLQGRRGALRDARRRPADDHRLGEARRRAPSASRASSAATIARTSPASRSAAATRATAPPRRRSASCRRAGSSARTPGATRATRSWGPSVRGCGLAACGTAPASSATTRSPTSTISSARSPIRSSGPTRARSSIRCCRRRGARATTVTDAAALHRAVADELRLLGARGSGEDPADLVEGDPRALRRLAPRRGRHRLRVVPRRQRRARQAQRHQAVVRAAFALSARHGARRRSRQRARASPSTASARAATRCCSRATPGPGRAHARARRTAGRQQHQHRRGARLPPRRLRRRRWRAATATIRTRPDAPRTRRARGARRRRSACAATPSSPAPRRSARTRTTIRAGAGGRCLGCHMPKKNLSLDNRLGRYHRIASPTETAKVEGDRPLECALCHADKSVESLVATMEAWWHKSYDRARLRALYGADLRTPIRSSRRWRAASRTSRRWRWRCSARAATHGGAAGRRAAHPPDSAPALLRGGRARDAARRAGPARRARQQRRHYHRRRQLAAAGGSRAAAATGVATGDGPERRGVKRTQGHVTMLVAVVAQSQAAGVDALQSLDLLQLPAAPLHIAVGTSLLRAARRKLPPGLQARCGLPRRRRLCRRRVLPRSERVQSRHQLPVWADLLRLDRVRWAVRSGAMTPA